MRVQTDLNTGLNTWAVNLERGSMEGLVMQYRKYNMDEELKKMLDGKIAKEDVGLTLYLSLKHYPAAQMRVASAFSIT